MSDLALRWRHADQRIGVEDFRRDAARRVPALVWTFVEGGADDLVTVRRNRDAFSRWALRTRVMTGRSEPDLEVNVAGSMIDVPVLLAPTGSIGLAHWRGDLAAARGAERSGTRLVLSTASSWTIEEVGGQTETDHFFQLYPGGAHTATLMARAWDAGYKALFVTVDVPVLGNREGERRRGFAALGSNMGTRKIAITPRQAIDVARHPRWLFQLYRHGRTSMRNLVEGTGVSGTAQSIAALHREITLATFNWEDLQWIREHWAGALYVKGILDPDDAVRAIDLGCEGVVVSNHGGRQLDQAIAALDALPAVADAVGGRGDVLFDGGIRRGTDIVKALALGARAVLIGRAHVYGLIVGGEQGVVDVLSILRAELARALCLMGVGSVNELDRSWLISVDGDSPAQSLTD